MGGGGAIDLRRRGTPPRPAPAGCAAALVVIVVVFSAILTRLVLNLKSALDGRGPF